VVGQEVAGRWVLNQEMENKEMQDDTEVNAGMRGLLFTIGEITSEYREYEKEVECLSRENSDLGLSVGDLRRKIMHTTPVVLAAIKLREDWPEGTGSMDEFEKGLCQAIDTYKEAAKRDFRDES
jgi:hypothetical protein